MQYNNLSISRFGHTERHAYPFAVFVFVFCANKRFADLRAIRFFDNLYAIYQFGIAAFRSELTELHYAACLEVAHCVATEKFHYSAYQQPAIVVVGKRRYHLFYFGDALIHRIVVVVGLVVAECDTVHTVGRAKRIATLVGFRVEYLLF